MFKKLIAYFIVLMLAVFGALYLSSAHADSMVLHTPDGATVVLSDSPCASDILENIKEEYKDQFRGAEARYGGSVITLCWIVLESDVIIIDAQGYGMAVPMSSFMKTSAVKTPKASI